MTLAIIIKGESEGRSYGGSGWVFKRWSDGHWEHSKNSLLFAIGISRKVTCFKSENEKEAFLSRSLRHLI
jgi:hypothetical protein